MKLAMNFSSTLSYISVCCQKPYCWQGYGEALDET